MFNSWVMRARRSETIRLSIHNNEYRNGHALFVTNYLKVTPTSNGVRHVI